MQTTSNKFANYTKEALIKKSIFSRNLAYICIACAIFYALGSILLLVEGIPEVLLLCIVGFLVLLYGAKVALKQRKELEYELQRRERKSTEEQAAIAQERKDENRRVTKIAAKWVVIAVIFAIILGAIIGIHNNNTHTQEGYWGSDGYYNPSDEEMEDVWEDVYDWLDKNW